MKKIFSIIFILSLFFSPKIYSQYNVESEVQKLDHNLTTTTQEIQQAQENSVPDSAVVTDGANTQEEVNLQDLDLDAIAEGEELELTLREKLSLLGYIIKIKTKEHFEKYGKWYLVGIVGAAGAISAYYYFHPFESK